MSQLYEADNCATFLQKEGRTSLQQVMVRTYKRKTYQGELSAENMLEAADKVLTKELTLRRAAEVYNVPFTSLQRRVTLSCGVIKQRGGKENAIKRSTLKQERLPLYIHLQRTGFNVMFVKNGAMKTVPIEEVPREARVDGFAAILRKRVASLMRRVRGPNSLLAVVTAKIASETWALTMGLMRKLKVTQRAMERAVLGVSLRVESEMMISAVELRLPT
ncbi:hypothetical protein MSG28_012047 [Choristoneura fumiferana]|uniref:Uncharacterized protein n=1 Tax=Choristoneura fumiferana TaxID=7141 RepID=A0ACC0KN86_CHOFU|nr:hypothetical protein MSG28_012047 [Choristoneura fumiferana]